MRAVSDSIWFTTRSALFRPGDEAWNEVALYAAPLERLLARRYAWLAASDREDLVQDVLIEMKQALAPAHDRARGRFRALLQTVVQRRVADVLRRRRGVALEVDVAAPEARAIDALDLEAVLLEAVARCRDELTQGPRKDPDALYALVDRIVHGLASKEIAARTNVSADRVARLLERGRDAIFAHLLGRELSIDGAELARAVSLFKECLRDPRRSAAATERAGRLGAAVVELHERFRAALSQFEGDGTASGRELRDGLAFVLEGCGA
jgi:DNA-directed RNA polymerase specialized sigma24 family protein